VVWSILLLCHCVWSPRYLYRFYTLRHHSRLRDRSPEVLLLANVAVFLYTFIYIGAQLVRSHVNIVLWAVLSAFLYGIIIDSYFMIAFRLLISFRMSNDQERFMEQEDEQFAMKRNASFGAPSSSNTSVRSIIRTTRMDQLLGSTLTMFTALAVSSVCMMMTQGSFVLHHTQLLHISLQSADLWG
jgi:hypothetical protein